ncbi:MAG TPA: methyltransferase domain-containing protein [Saprospiraceae bacterium]|nr:methyltransferase domain-containing protein [Saprospiraceae bacterium]
MTESVAAQKPTLPPSLKKLIEALHGEYHYKPADIARVLRESHVQEEDLKPWMDFNHADRDGYGRKLVYKSPYFEVMVMSWKPGDFSAIHDHGHTQWGAVKIFGPAEHATFRVEDDRIYTLARWRVKPGDIVGVGHSLIHQMGNPEKEQSFISLHVYGDFQKRNSITGDARIFDVDRGEIQRVDGGVFYHLSADAIQSVEKGPYGDFPTQLRNRMEKIRRWEKIGGHEKEISEMKARAFHSAHLKELRQTLDIQLDEHGHALNSSYWKMLNTEMIVAAECQKEDSAEAGEDKFHKYAELYDELIGRTSLNSFIADYLDWLSRKHGLDFQEMRMISLGCGTGLVEAYMMEHYQIPKEQMYGIDISEAMVHEAGKRMNADVGDVLTLDPEIDTWDLAYSGLNVFQYLDFRRIQEAIEKTAAIVKPGGYFIGDFITPDHIRWYPNVMSSGNGRVISLRTPSLVEQEGRIFQESEITNVSFLNGEMEVHYSGKHKRFLPPIHRIRKYFEEAFGSEVHLYDAKSLEEIPEWADSCASTRYVVLARKQ